jgi:hypothetical protein
MQNKVGDKKKCEKCGLPLIWTEITELDFNTNEPIGEPEYEWTHLYETVGARQRAKVGGCIS